MLVSAATGCQRRLSAGCLGNLYPGVAGLVLDDQVSSDGSEIAADRPDPRVVQIPALNLGHLALGNADSLGY